MKLLNALYSSPAQLLEKAKRDGTALVQALTTCEEQEVRDALFNFAVSAYHIWDWIKAYEPHLKQEVTLLLDESEAIAACRDLSNASKHVTLTLDRGAYLKHPPVVEDVSMSATARGTLSEIKDFLGAVDGRGNTPIDSPPWRLKIQLVSGRRIPAEQLVTEAIEAWEKFFNVHGIH
jgi:hypothetical protein